MMIKILYLWSPTSITSQLMKPLISDLSNELENISLDLININDKPVIKKKYLITTTPTIIIIKDDEEIDRIIGYKNKNDLKLKIEEIILKNEMIN